MKKRKRVRWVKLYERNGRVAYFKKGRVVVFEKCPSGYHSKVVL